MKPTRKSLLTITTQATLSLQSVDPLLTLLERQKQVHAIHLAFDVDCCQAFDLDDRVPHHKACMAAWWDIAHDIALFDSLFRKAYPGEVVND